MFRRRYVVETLGQEDRVLGVLGVAGYCQPSSLGQQCRLDFYVQRLLDPAGEKFPFQGNDHFLHGQLIGAGKMGGGGQHPVVLEKPARHRRVAQERGRDFIQLGSVLLPQRRPRCEQCL